MKNYCLILLLSMGISCTDEKIETGMPTPSQSNISERSFEPANSYSCTNLLVDASHDGGAWWFPQVGTFNAQADHQGLMLANYWRNKGYRVDVVPRGVIITEELMKNYAVVVRAGGFGSYESSEIIAYDNALKRGITLILLSDHSAVDKLGEEIGVTFSGKTSATSRIIKFSNHAIVNQVSGVKYIAGSFITNARSNANILSLGWSDENSDYPVMALLKHPTSSIFALGDVNCLESTPQPFTDNLLVWMKGACNKE